MTAFVAWLCRHLPGRKPPPRRTAADVMADLAQARRDRDLTTCQLIWNLTAVEPRKEQQ